MSLILIADDNPHAHRMGRQILSQEGYEVATTSDGDETLQYLTDHLPDLVLVDTRMPGPSGFEVCQRIKRQPNLSQVKVVLLAGPLEPFDPAQAEAAGSDGVLHKPLDAYSLIDTVKSLIGEAKAPEEIREPEPEQEPAAALRNLHRSTQMAELPEAPEPDMAFEEAGAVATVEESPGTEEMDDARRAELVRHAVEEVLTASIPTLVDTLTERVLARLKQL